jgi:hypothetical protein
LSIVIAKSSFVHQDRGLRHEVHKGDLLSSDHWVVGAKPKEFAPASTAQIRDAVNRERPDSDRREV